MYTLGQTLFLDLGLRGKQEVRVIATGGGHTTVLPLGRVDGSVFYGERGRPKAFKDADLAREVVE